MYASTLSDTLYGRPRMLPGRAGGWDVTVPPVGEPLSLSGVKSYLRVEDESEDDLIRRLMKAARERIERRYGALFLAQTVRLSATGRMSYLPLPVAPVTEVSAVSRVSDAGLVTALPLSSYPLTVGMSPSLGFSGAGAMVEAGTSLRIDLVGGYASATYVPEVLLQAIRMIVADAYDHRGSFTTGTIVARFPDSVDAWLSDAGYRRL